MRTRLAFVVVALALGGCATQFFGMPTVEGGRAACEKICAGWSMELAGMVQMGDYSNGCVCQVPGKMVPSAAAAAAGEAGVAVYQAQMQQHQNDAMYMSSPAPRP